MATDSGSDPQIEITRLQDEVTHLQARLEELEAQQETERESVRRVGWFGLRVFVGGDLRRSFQAWIEAKTLRDPLPSAETADLAAALVQRLVRVSLVGLAVAALPTALLVWQNWEIRRQSQIVREQIQEQSVQHSRTVQQQARQLDQQVRDAWIVRRAQLLATIYECKEAPDSNSSADDSPVPQTGESAAACKPRAHLRAREEAVRAFVEIERDRGRNPNLTRADLAHMDLYGLDLRGARLDQANLSHTILTTADLRRANLYLAILTGAGLSRTDLRSAEFSGTDLRDATLSGANLSGTLLLEAKLHGADLSGAILRGSDLRGATLTLTQLRSTEGDAETLLPHSLARPDHWSH